MSARASLKRGREEAEGEEPDAMSILELRATWELVSVVQFCGTFREALWKMPKFTIEDLEHSITRSAESRLIGDVHASLLSGIYMKEITSLDWETTLAALMKRQPAPYENPLAGGLDYHFLSSSVKAKLLYKLCEMRMDAMEDLRTFMQNNEGGYDDFRQEPLGTDKAGRVYWYFKNGDDMRLYAEDAPPPQKRYKFDEDATTNFDLVAHTLDEWRAISQLVKGPKTESELRLTSAVRDEILPHIESIHQAREKQAEKQRMLDLMPRKRSSRIAVQEQERQVRMSEAAAVRAVEEAERRERSERAAELARAREREERAVRRQLEEEALAMASQPRRVLDRDQMRERQQHIVKTTTINQFPTENDGKPILPLPVGRITLLTLGTIPENPDAFHNDKYIWPIGYSSSRLYPSIKNPGTETVYVSTIEDGGGRPLFVVTCPEDPEFRVARNAPSSTWTDVINMCREKLGKRTKCVGGPESFGLTIPTIQYIVQHMPGVDRCQRYQPQPIVIAGEGGKGDKDEDVDVEVVEVPKKPVGRPPKQPKTDGQPAPKSAPKPRAPKQPKTIAHDGQNGAPKPKPKPKPRPAATNYVSSQPRDYSQQQGAGSFYPAGYGAHDAVTRDPLGYSMMQRAMYQGQMHSQYPGYPTHTGVPAAAPSMHAPQHAPAHHGSPGHHGGYAGGSAHQMGSMYSQYAAYGGTSNGAYGAAAGGSGGQAGAGASWPGYMQQSPMAHHSSASPLHYGQPQATSHYGQTAAATHYGGAVGMQAAPTHHGGMTHHAPSQHHSSAGQHHAGASHHASMSQSMAQPQLNMTPPQPMSAGTGGAAAGGYMDQRAWPAPSEPQAHGMDYMQQ